MNINEAFRTAVDDLSAHKLRSSLTMLGMIFGVAAVVAMLSIGAGAERQAMETIAEMGLHNVIVRATEATKEELERIRKDSPGVSSRDADAIKEGVDGVEMVTARVEIKPAKVRAAATKSEARAYGVSWRQLESGGMRLADGRLLDARDEETHAQVCVLGWDAGRDLFGYGEAIGQDVKVNDVWLEVVGVLAPSASSQTTADKNAPSAGRSIYLPVTTAVRKFERDLLESPLDEIIVELREGESPMTAASAIRTLVGRLHGQAEDFEVVVPEALLEQSRKTQRLFNLVMGAIAGISLLVGGIGIMNIMLATVLERTREIGIRRAVGARRIEIRNQFLIESFAMSLLGGTTGVLVGIGLAQIVAAYAGWPTIVTMTSIVVSTGVSGVVGVVSGMYPAVRAAALDPIEALRYE